MKERSLRKCNLTKGEAKNIIFVATRNRGKLQEIKDLLRGEGYLLHSLIDYPHVPPIDETGKTLEENARKKALEVAKLTGYITLADDSSLEIDALSGKPGITSARFLGAQATDRDRNLKVLQLVNGLPEEERKARFRCVIAIAKPDGSCESAEGQCRGFIADRPRGRRGFGYDPIFYVSRYKKTMAEIEPGLKNRISHRALAMQKARKILRRMEQGDCGSVRGNEGLGGASRRRTAV
jgi:XTP/dITP diphosphohydrolase